MKNNDEIDENPKSPQKLSEREDIETSVGGCGNIFSKRFSMKNIKTFNSAQSFDAEPIPSDASHKKQLSYPQNYQFNQSTYKQTNSTQIKKSLSENLNYKTCTFQQNNLPVIKKIVFRISWTPLNRFLCCCLLGHVGISNCEGVVYDFKNNFFIGADSGDNELRLFGRPTKDLYLELENEDEADRLQQILRFKQQIYTSKEGVVGRYKLLKNNCHHFVADVLNTFQYKQKQNYSALWVWKQTLCHAEYRNCKGLLKTWATPLILFLLFIILIALYLVDFYCNLNIFQ